MFVKDREHVGPEGFLPFEDSLFGDNVRGNIRRQATLKKQMRQWLNVIVGVVIHNHSILTIGQITLVNHERGASIFWQIGGEQSSLSNLIPSSTILSSYGMTFEKYRSLVS